MNPEERFAQLHEIAQIAACAVNGVHYDYTDVEDLSQEGILWLLSPAGQKRVKSCSFPDGSIHRNQLIANVIERALMPLVKAERKHALGFEDPDPAYSEKMVELVLPAVFDPHYELPKQVQERVQTDPASGNNFAAYVTDVKRAVDTVCSLDDRRVLFTRSVGGWTWAHFAAVYSDRSDEWYRLHYKDALTRIVAFLNAGVVLVSSDDADALEAALSEPAIGRYKEQDS